MLLRDMQLSDFRVPRTARHQIAPDTESSKRDQANEEALRRRDQLRAGLATAHERARARAAFATLFAEDGGAEGAVARSAAALKKYKAEPGALTGNEFGALEQDVRTEALRIEALAKARDRVLQVGRNLDTLIEATRATPGNFAAHAEAARETITRAKLPDKIAKAFRARLAEIPEAALVAQIEQDPPQAISLIEQREGPANPKFGIDNASLRVLAKQASAALAEREREKRAGESAIALRARVDAADEIAAAKRGEANGLTLSSWLTNAEAIGPAGTRALRRESKDVAKVIERRTAVAAYARARVARGKETDAEGVDELFAEYDGPGVDDALAIAEVAGALPKSLQRQIEADMKSEDAGRVAQASALIVKLEAKSPALISRLAASVRNDAHTVVAAIEAGFGPTDALRHLREAADIETSDSRRRIQSFDQAVDGGTVAAAVEHTFAIRAAGIDRI